MGLNLSDSMSHEPERSIDQEKQRSVRSSELFQGANRVVINHQGCQYLLQITRQGKLILTK